MGLLDSNRPKIKVSSAISYDMATTGNILAFNNTLGYKLLVVDIAATIDSANTGSGIIRCFGDPAVSGYTYHDFFDENGNLYSSYRRDFTIKDIHYNSGGSKHIKIYIDISGWSYINIVNVTTATATLSVQYTLSDGDMSSIIARKPIQQINHFTVTGDGSTKIFGGYPWSIRMPSGFKYFQIIMTASDNINGTITNLYKFYDHDVPDATSVVFEDTIGSFDGNHKTTEWIELNGCLEMRPYLKCSTAPASGVAIDVFIMGIR